MELASSSAAAATAPSLPRSQSVGAATAGGARRMHQLPLRRGGVGVGGGGGSGAALRSGSLAFRPAGRKQTLVAAAAAMTLILVTLNLASAPDLHDAGGGRGGGGGGGGVGGAGVLNAVHGGASFVKDATRDAAAAGSRSGSGHDAAAGGEAELPLSRLKVVTILTQPRKWYCAMLASARHHGVDVRVYGWGDGGLSGHRGWYRKLLWFRAILAGFEPHDVVVFADAGDVLFTGSLARIRDGYLAAVRDQPAALPRGGDKEWVWSAERNCGMRTLTRAQCQELHRIPAARGNGSSATPYRYLNTGGWAGRAGEGTRLFAQVDRDRAGRTADADQAYVAETHVRRGWKDRHGLDFNQRLFFSLYKSKHALCGWPSSVGDPPRNCETRTTPPILHFNAGAKEESYETVFRASPVAAEAESAEGRRALDAHPVSVNGRPATFGDLCPLGYGYLADSRVREAKGKTSVSAEAVAAGAAMVKAVEEGK
eukprot:Rhum_TRINITY_DN3412_c0_g4::Rhum_TRINITY_DN3412_c0_g4_i1::g.10751::m.10751